MTAPRTIQVITRAKVWGDDQEPVAVQIDGQIVDWADAPIERDGDNLCLDGKPYKFGKQLDARREDGWTYFANLYRLQIGYNVLTSHTLTGDGPMGPDLQHPVSFAEAVEYARSIVTRNLSAYGTKVKAHVVPQPQHGDIFGDSVAIIEGQLHTRQEAANALLRGEYLPLDWKDDEAGDAPTPPASRSTPSNDGQEPTRIDDTIIRDLAQVRTVSPEWGGQPGTNAVKAGITEVWDSRPFAEVEELVRSLGWRPIGKQGAWQNPKWDAEAEQTRQKWERKLAARYGTA